MEIKRSSEFEQAMFNIQNVQRHLEMLALELDSDAAAHLEELANVLSKSVLMASKTY